MSKALKPVQQRDLISRLAEVLINSGITVEEAAAQFHRALLETALAENDGCQVKTAQQHGMHRNTLRNQMIALGLLRGPKPLTRDGRVDASQARVGVPERFPTPAPGLPLTAEQMGTLRLQQFLDEGDVDGHD